MQRVGAILPHPRLLLVYFVARLRHLPISEEREAYWSCQARLCLAIRFITRERRRLQSKVRARRSSLRSDAQIPQYGGFLLRIIQ
jgi:hypothetical protein